MESQLEKTMTIYDIPTILKEAPPYASTPVIIRNGFKVSGIWPFNRAVFRDDEFLSSCHRSPRSTTSTRSLCCPGRPASNSFWHCQLISLTYSLATKQISNQTNSLMFSWTARLIFQMIRYPRSQTLSQRISSTFSSINSKTARQTKLCQLSSWCHQGQRNTGPFKEGFLKKDRQWKSQKVSNSYFDKHTNREAPTRWNKPKKPNQKKIVGVAKSSSGKEKSAKSGKETRKQPRSVQDVDCQLYGLLRSVF